MMTKLAAALHCLLPLPPFANIHSSSGAPSRPAGSPSTSAQPSPALPSLQRHFPVPSPSQCPASPRGAPERLPVSPRCFICPCCTPLCHPFLFPVDPTLQTLHVPPPTTAIREWDAAFPGLLLHRMNFCVHGHSLVWNRSLIKGSVPINWECLKFQNPFIFVPSIWHSVWNIINTQ